MHHLEQWTNITDENNPISNYKIPCWQDKLAALKELRELIFEPFVTYNLSFKETIDEKVLPNNDTFYRFVIKFTSNDNKINGEIVFENLIDEGGYACLSVTEHEIKSKRSSLENNYFLKSLSNQRGLDLLKVLW